MGLTLKSSKTFITHTLHEHAARTGFDFLGFTVRQFRTGKHPSLETFQMGQMAKPP
jgi:RNA-directed DNA polymerase